PAGSSWLPARARSWPRAAWARPPRAAPAPCRRPSRRPDRRPAADKDPMVNNQIEDLLPLSPLQQGMLFHSLYDERAADVYTTQLRFDLAGPLIAGDLRAAAAAMLARHPALRAGFHHQGVDEPVQVIRRTVPLPWRTADLTGIPDADAEAEAARLAGQDAGRRFDLARPPLLRFLLIRFGDERHRLVLTSHHLLFDGWSASVLRRELFAACARH